MNLSRIVFDKCLEYEDFTQYYFSGPDSLFEEYGIPCTSSPAEIMIEYLTGRPVRPDAHIAMVYIGPGDNQFGDWTNWKSVELSKEDIQALIEKAEERLEQIERD